jgi:hypothetical protein
VKRPEDLLERHIGGAALVDSNLLLLYLVGKCDPRIIPRFTRTRKYTTKDFDLLSRILDRVFKVVLTTPNILTEVSNLATKLSDNERPAFFDEMKKHVTVFDERYCASIGAFADRQCRRLGLTDAVLLSLCPNVLVLTDDLPLYQVIATRGHDVINFTHVRAAAGMFL